MKQGIIFKPFTRLMLNRKREAVKRSFLLILLDLCTCDVTKSSSYSMTSPETDTFYFPRHAKKEKENN